MKEKRENSEDAHARRETRRTERTIHEFVFGNPRCTVILQDGCHHLSCTDSVYAKAREEASQVGTPGQSMETIQSIVLLMFEKFIPTVESKSTSCTSIHTVWAKQYAKASITSYSRHSLLQFFPDSGDDRTQATSVIAKASAQARGPTRS